MRHQIVDVLGQGFEALRHLVQRRLADAPDRSKARVYTFTADGRVTVAPGQVCRYRIEAASLAVDCDGAAGEAARGRLERRNGDTLLWRVDDKIVELERQAGVKEQQ